MVKKTRQEMSAHGIDSESGMLTGTWRNVLGNKNIAKKKFQNFQQYRVLFPEYGFIFNGDSGQGDALVGFMMLTRYPNSVSLCSGYFFPHELKQLVNKALCFSPQIVSIFTVFFFFGLFFSIYFIICVCNSLCKTLFIY